MASPVLFLLLLVMIEMTLAVVAEDISSSSSSSSGDNKEIRTIILGSCDDQKLNTDTQLWNAIHAMKPDVFAWIGDNIYPNEDEDPNNPEKDEADKKRQYEIQARKPGYQKVASSSTVIGVWDDHDYGGNDSGRDYPRKETSKKLMLDFLNEPENSPRRSQKGVYASYIFGTAPRTVKVILMDMRYFKDEARENNELLGEEQWKWLEKELLVGDQAVNVLVSSIQVVNEISIFSEKWSDWRREKERLYRLLNETDIRTILISGDRHYGEIARDCTVHLRHGGLLEVTSSGLTQTRPARYTIFDCNDNRVSEPVNDQNFASVEFDWEGGRLHTALRNERGEALASAFFEISGPPRPCLSGDEDKKSYDLNDPKNRHLRGYVSHRPRFCGVSFLVFFVVVCLLAIFVFLFGIAVVLTSSRSKFWRCWKKGGRVDDDDDESSLLSSGGVSMSAINNNNNSGDSVSGLQPGDEESGRIDEAGAAAAAIDRGSRGGGLSILSMDRRKAAYRRLCDSEEGEENA